MTEFSWSELRTETNTKQTVAGVQRLAPDTKRRVSHQQVYVRHAKRAALSVVSLILFHAVIVFVLHAMNTGLAYDVQRARRVETLSKDTNIRNQSFLDEMINSRTSLSRAVFTTYDTPYAVLEAESK